MTRTSGPLDISRATGRGDNAYSGSWTLTSYAICALPAGGIHSEATIAPGVFATHHCTPGDSVAGPGGGGGLVDGGPVYLKVLYPFSNFDVEVQMTGFLPDRKVLASPTCADRIWQRQNPDAAALRGGRFGRTLQWFRGLPELAGEGRGRRGDRRARAGVRRFARVQERHEQGSGRCRTERARTLTARRPFPAVAQLGVFGLQRLVDFFQDL
jgi:hypothetical protein